MLYAYAHHNNGVTWVTWHLESPICLTISWCVHQWQHQSSTLLAFCEGNPLVTSGFPSQSTSNMENVSMSWCLHILGCLECVMFALPVSLVASGGTRLTMGRPVVITAANVVTLPGVWPLLNNDHFLEAKNGWNEMGSGSPITFNPLYPRLYWRNPKTFFIFSVISLKHRLMLLRSKTKNLFIPHS